MAWRQERHSATPDTGANLSADRATGPRARLSQRFRRRTGPDTAVPRLLPLIGAAIAVGGTAGALELAVFALQVDVLNLVDLNSIRISRHVYWMIPAAEFLVAAPLALALILPVAARIRRKARRGIPVDAARAWGWAGAVLGTLLVLGPLLAIRGLHPWAALVLALGLGFRLRHLMARPTPRWGRAASWAGIIAIGALPTFGLWQWDRVARAGERALALPPVDAPNVIWIVMDTVRADRLSLYGYGRPTTPGLERWAREGVTFDEARSAAPWTLPSHVSMFTGLWPYQQGARIDRPYRRSFPTIAEHLGGQGFTTAGFVANTGMCNACFGVGRGCDTYVELACNHEVSLRATMLNSALGRQTLRTLHGAGIKVPTQFPFPGRSLAPTIVERGRRWLEGLGERGVLAADSGRPFFLFLNFMDAHGPYVPAERAPRPFSGDRPMPPRAWCNPTTGSAALRAVAAADPDDRPRLQEELEDTTRLLSDLYDDCLLGLDAEIAGFLDELRAAGTLEKTWVIVTADHGEYFGEHGLFGHGGRLHNEVTRVPLLMIPPLGRPGDGDDPAAALRGRRIGSPVSLRDLPATLCDLLTPEASHPFHGGSLARHWGPGGAEPAPILMEMEDQPLEGKDVTAEGIVETDALVHEGYILLTSTGRPDELYRIDDRRQERDLAADPAEQERLGRMHRVLQGLLGGETPAP